MPENKASTTTQADAPRQICLQDCEIDYALRRSSRRSIGFRIDDQGLRVTAPHRASQALIDSALQAKQGWILQKLEARRQQPPPSPRPIWEEGSRLPFLGREVRLQLVGPQPPLPFYCAQSACLALALSPTASPERVRTHLQQRLQEEAGPWLEARLQAQAARMGLQAQGFSLSSARGRWGSCSAAGRIRLNWRLIHLAPELADYVAVHELAHLREMNHGPRFWAIVAAFFPEHRQARKALREHGQRIMQLLEPA